MTAASSWPEPFASMPICRVRTLADIHVPTNPMGASVYLLSVVLLLLIHDHDALIVRPPAIDSSSRVRLPLVLCTLMSLELYCFYLLLFHQHQERLGKLAPDRCCFHTHHHLLRPSMRYRPTGSSPRRHYHCIPFCCFLLLIFPRIASRVLRSSFAMR